MPRKRRHFQDAMAPAPRVRQSLEESLKQAGIYKIIYPDIILKYKKRR